MAAALRWIVALALLVVADAGSKHWASAQLRAHGTRVLAAGHVRLEYRENRGMAFGVFRKMAGNRVTHYIKVYNAAMAAALAALLLAVLIKRRGKASLGTAGLLCLLAGTIGNLIDRLRHSWVIDFIELRPQAGTRWPAFNAADVLIAAGVVLCFVALFLVRRQGRLGK